MTASRRTRVALAGALLVLAACGLPDDRRPRIIAAEEAPLDLNEVPSGADAGVGGGDDEVDVYLVRNGLLEAVTRSAEDTDLATTIGLLLEGATDDEEARGFRTVIPLETELLSAVPEGTVAIVDLGCTSEVSTEACGVSFPTGQDSITIFAQLTCTATGVAGVEAVRFLQEGVPLDVSTSEGAIVESPGVVTCDDYRGLLG